MIVDIIMIIINVGWLIPGHHGKPVVGVRGQTINHHVLLFTLAQGLYLSRHVTNVEDNSSKTPADSL